MRAPLGQPLGAAEVPHGTTAIYPGDDGGSPVMAGLLFWAEGPFGLDSPAALFHAGGHVVAQRTCPPERLP